MTNEIEKSIKKTMDYRGKQIGEAMDRKEKAIRLLALLNNSVAIVNLLEEAEPYNLKDKLEEVRKIARILEKMLDTGYMVNVNTLIKTLSNEEQENYKPEATMFDRQKENQDIEPFK